MPDRSLARLGEDIRAARPLRAMGRVVRATHGVLTLQGLGAAAALGDAVEIATTGGPLRAEIVDLSESELLALADGSGEGVRLGDAATLHGAPSLAPDDSWIGRIVDPHGQPLDGRPLRRGPVARSLRAAPPPPTRRRALGPRLATGLAVFDTLLPIVRGQRIGLFSGSGVGKSSLLADLACGMEADVVVMALVGERGREVRDFALDLLGAAGRARALLVVATSDQPPLTRRRALWAAMTAAEHFRDRGAHVLFLADSVTRFAEAHREVALASGESAALRGFPPSLQHLIMALAERAGPGPEDAEGDITALLTVLVAGSDMEEPVADILRGVLDGHVVLDRGIAERGRFPAVDVLRSVSRSLPRAASEGENTLILRARRLLGVHDRSEMMIQSGLYAPGSDPDIDAAIAAWPRLDAFLSERAPAGPAAAFERLGQCLRRSTLAAP
jgi:flagellum-specific ATP synthase